MIEIADLSWVLVRQRQSGPELVLCTGDRTVVCPATVRSPLLRVDPRLLADWLGQALAPADPGCPLHSTLNPARLARDGWLEAPDVARIWQVQAQDVPAVAARYEVRRPGNVASQDSPPTMSSGVPSRQHRSSRPAR